MVSPPEQLAGELPKRAQDRSTGAVLLSSLHPALQRNPEPPLHLSQPRLDLRVALAHRREQPVVVVDGRE